MVSLAMKIDYLQVNCVRFGVWTIAILEDEMCDLVAATRNLDTVRFDNLSRLPEELADAACRLATGGGFGGRELYTDHDEATFDAITNLARATIACRLRDAASADCACSSALNTNSGLGLPIAIDISP
jgi:hypothetical protein